VFELIAPLITAVKNAGPPIYTAVLVATLFLVLLPDPYLTQLGLVEIRLQYRTAIGIALIASASLLIVSTLFALAPHLGNRWKVWRLHRDTFHSLKTLTKAEKEFLMPYILGGENTRNVSIYDGVANGLRAKAIIYRASDVTIPGRSGMLCPHNMQPYARELLNKHRRFLDIEQ
jgi:hypothetical protein